MRICDRCDTVGKKVKAHDRITFEIEGHELDLCNNCVQDISEFVYNRQKKPLLSINRNKE